MDTAKASKREFGATAEEFFRRCPSCWLTNSVWSLKKLSEILKSTTCFAPSQTTTTTTFI